MSTAIPIELYDILERKLGKEDAREVGKVIQRTFDVIEEKAKEKIPVIKAEIKEELTRELASKADILVLKEEFFGEIKLLRQEMETLRQEIKTDILRLDRKFTIMFIILFFTVIFLNQNALEFLVRVLGLVK